LCIFCEMEESKKHYYLIDNPLDHLIHSVDKVSWQERAIGCLVGLAVGDAVGISLEFARRPSCESEVVTDMIGNNRLYVTYWGGEKSACLPGEWSDDTSMALALGESLINNNKFVPQDVMNKWVAWKERGYLGSRNFRPNRPANLRNEPAFDIGITIRNSLDYYVKSKGVDVFAGKAIYLKDEKSCVPSNGSIMRLAPVVLFSMELLKGDKGKAVYELAKMQSELTHGHPAAGDACQLLAHILSMAISGKSKKSVLLAEDFDFSLLSDTDDGKRIRDLFRADSSWMKKKRSQLVPFQGHIGSAEFSLECALWSILKTNNFTDAILMGINLGGDADTVGAIIGQIAGAIYGLESIPKEWREKIVGYNDIVDLARKIIRAGEISNRTIKHTELSTDTTSVFALTTIKCTSQ
jgi:ADP-ribosyl-[dinitrogen reductase] hydrolase